MKQYKRPDGLIERKPTGYQTMDIRFVDGMKTYHNINGMWGEKLWHEGEWAIYKPAGADDIPRSGGWNAVIIHSKIWREKRFVHKEPSNINIRWRANSEEEMYQPHSETEEIELVCHTQMFPTNSTRCLTCSAEIPEGAIAMWKMLNWDRLSEEQDG